MSLVKVSENNYSIKNKGFIKLDKKDYLQFDINTKTLMDIFPAFLKRIKGKEMIFYKGDNPYLRYNYFTKEDLTTIYLRNYRCFLKSDYLDKEDYIGFFKARGNWNVDTNKNLKYELYYIQGGDVLRDKSLWNTKSYLSNRPDRESMNITEKHRHHQLVSPALKESFLSPQVYFTLTPKFSPKTLKSFIDKNGITILKPIDGFGGKSIYVIEDFESFVKTIKMLKAIKNKENWSSKKSKFNEGITKLYWVLEKYIDKPHLYKGRKYHFRAYYTFTKDGKGYLYKSFRMAYALEKYKVGDFNNADIHDTHYVKRKVKNEYIFLENFLKASDFNKTLEAMKILFTDITNNLTISCYPRNVECFQTFAVDLMLDENLNLKLIEFNTNAGFNKDLTIAEEILESCLYHIIDPIFPPKNRVDNPGYFIELDSNISNPKGLILNSDLEKQKYIDKVVDYWYSEGYGPKAKKDKTGGYYLACVELLVNNSDFHIHIVGPKGKYHPNAWSRKIKERRKWEKIEFKLTPKETAFRIYVSSGYKDLKECKEYLSENKK